MYAIRSYYVSTVLFRHGWQPRQWIMAHIIPRLYVCLRWEYTEFCLGIYGENTWHRITSYNVCYTKLLRKLYHIAEDLERAALKFQDHAPLDNGQVSGKIRIGCPDGLGNCFLAPELKRLQAQNPLLEIELVSVPFYYSLSKREVDILITVTKPSAKKIFRNNFV